MGWLKVLAWVVLAASVAWIVYQPGFESGIACAVAVSTVIGLHVKERRRSQPSIVQSQKVSGGSTGIQAGGNVRVDSTRGPDR